MPSFDIVSEVDMHEVTNAVDQSNREVTTRFDFKGTGAEYKSDKEGITLSAQNDFQLKQMLDILTTKLSKRNLDIKCMDIGKPQIALNSASQIVKIKQGLDQPTAKDIVKIIKDAGLKVQASIQGDKVRVTGKKRDDLQDVIALMRKQDLSVALQYNNFRD